MVELHVKGKDKFPSTLITCLKQYKGEYYTLNVWSRGKQLVLFPSSPDVASYADALWVRHAKWGGILRDEPKERLRRRLVLMFPLTSSREISGLEGKQN